MSIMKDVARAMAAGMVTPTEETCTTCHNGESPTFNGFDFDAMVARIAHPNPQKTTAK